MKFVFGLAAAFAVMASAAQAAIVNLAFTTEITSVSNGSAVGLAVGNLFNGSIDYDDTQLNDNGDGTFSVFDPNVQVNFAFNFPNDFVSPELFVVGATVNGAGKLVGLDFSIDVPNSFFFSANPDGTFSFDFSQLDANQNQVTIASGGGKYFDKRVPDVPIPGAALLFLSGAGAFFVRRRLAR